MIKITEVPQEDHVRIVPQGSSIPPLDAAAATQDAMLHGVSVSWLLSGWMSQNGSQGHGKVMQLLQILPSPLTLWYMSPVLPVSHGQGRMFTVREPTTAYTLQPML